MCAGLGSFDSARAPALPMELWLRSRVSAVTDAVSVKADRAEAPSSPGGRVRCGWGHLQFLHNSASLAPQSGRFAEAFQTGKRTRAPLVMKKPTGTKKWS